MPVMEKETITLSRQALGFLRQLEDFWWEVSECVHCKTIVLDYELISLENDDPDCGCNDDHNNEEVA